MHNIASHDSLCRKLSTELNRIVVSVGYRLAPEFPYPACMEDGRAAFKWVYENAPVFGGISEKIVLSGDSAGATISVSVCLWNIKHGLPFRRGLVLFYGMYGAVSEDERIVQDVPETANMSFQERCRTGVWGFIFPKTRISLTPIFIPARH